MPSEHGEDRKADQGEVRSVRAEWQARSALQAPSRRSGSPRAYQDGEEESRGTDGYGNTDTLNTPTRMVDRMTFSFTKAKGRVLVGSVRLSDSLILDRRSEAAPISSASE